MVSRFRVWGPFALSLLVLSPALGQDSVSRDGCLPGDSVSPYDLTEQCNSYVVDMSTFTTSWGTTFGLAPLAKTSQTNLTFSGSLISSQTISRDQLDFVPFPSESYSFWDGPGFGVNGNSAVNDAGVDIDVQGLLGQQFSAAMTQFSTTTAGAQFSGIIGTMVNVLPTEPTRLYVKRVEAAANGCDPSVNLSGMALGSVDAGGNAVIRADCFLCAGAAVCDVEGIAGNNVFGLDLAMRDCSMQNVISGEYPGGFFDVNATTAYILGDDLPFNTPGLMPASVRGGTPLLMGSNFGTEYVRGTSTADITRDMSHLAGLGSIDHRGGVSYSLMNCASLSSTHGLAGMLGYANGNCDGGGGACADRMLVWGLDEDGSVTGNIELELPAMITDNATGFVNLFKAGFDNEFNNYHSQVAFRGGNGQVSLGRDQQGRLLAAAQVDHPFNGEFLTGSHNWDFNYIAVARYNCASQETEWTMAGYTTFGGGKPILDGPTGAVIGTMTNINDDGSGGGPAVSSPMIDSVGNVWFISSIRMNDDPEFITRGLIRAVYDPATFSYRLELVLRRFTTYVSQNTGLTYQLNFIDLTDNDSISSGTTFSQNISNVAHMNQDPSGLAPVNPQTLGGLVLSAGIVYDRNGDGDFLDCEAGETGGDEEYNVLLYIGSIEPTPGCTNANVCDDGDVCTINRCAAGLCSVAPRTFGDVNDDNLVDVFDELCVLDALQFEAEGSCASSNADLSPCEQDGVVDTDDVSVWAGAFGGQDVCCAPPTGGCCTIGVCEIKAESDCVAGSGEYLGDGTNCVGVVCPETGACCLIDGCTDNVSVKTCASLGGQYRGNGTLCALEACPEIGACCVQGICSDAVVSEACDAMEGLFQGGGTTCENTTCPRGACCLAGSCTDGRVEASCLSDGGEYQGDNIVCSGVSCPAPPPITINEIRIDEPGSDLNEYFELTGPAGASLGGLTYIVIGDGFASQGSGVIEAIADLSGLTIPSDGHLLIAEAVFTLATPDAFISLNFENNDNVTHLLVSGFTGGLANDLDDDNDCVLDVTPWTTILDSVSLIEDLNFPSPTAECVYGQLSVGPDNGFVPAHAFRCPDGDGVWQIGLFAPVGQTDTPGEINDCSGVPSPAPIAARSMATRKAEPTDIEDEVHSIGVASMFAGSASPEAGSPTISLIPVGGTGNEIDALPGETIVFEVFIDGLNADFLRGYQVVLPASVASDVSGVLSIDNITVDTARFDYAFTTAGSSFPAFGIDGNARLANGVFDESAALLAGPTYAGEFTYTLSATATGNFAVDIEGANQPGMTNLVNQNDATVNISVVGAVVRVFCEMNEQCNDGLFCNGVEECVGTSCLFGPIPCTGLPCDESGDVCCDGGDTDCDGDVDVFDYLFFHGCFTGHDGMVSLECQGHDGDLDGNIDLIDYGTFQDRFDQ